MQRTLMGMGAKSGRAEPKKYAQRFLSQAHPIQLPFT
jgi:hypothetical protein